MFRLKVGECLITYSGWSLSRTEYPCGRFDISVLELGGYCCPDGLVFAESLAVSRMVRLYLISEYHFRLDSPSVEKFCGPFLNDGSQIMMLASVSWLLQYHCTETKKASPIIYSIYTIRETKTLPAFKKQLKLYLIGHQEY